MKKLFNFRVSGSLLMLSLLFFIACQKDKETQTVQEDTFLKSVNFEQLQTNRIRLAQALSVAINDEDFLQIISQKCLESKLREAEILYSDILDLKIPNKKDTTVAVFLASLETRGGLKVRSSEVDEFYSRLIVEQDPLLSIVLLPGRNKERSTLVTTNNAKKVFIDKIIEDFKDGESITYTLNGRSYTQPYFHSKEPDEVYFAIKLNEEYIAFDRRTEVVYYNAPKTLRDAGNYIDYDWVKSEQALVKRKGNIIVAYKNKELAIDGVQKTLETRTSCGQECERDCKNGKDAITRIKFTHDYEGWPRGGPEFIMQYALGFNSTGTSNVTTNPYGFVLSGSAKNYYNLGGDEFKWYTSNASKTSLTAIQLFTWNKTQHSRDMMQHWSEDDGSFKSSELNLALKANVKIDGVGQEVGLSYKWTFTRGDDEIGSVIVQYCDPWSDSFGYEYVVAGPNGDITFAQLDRNY